MKRWLMILLAAVFLVGVAVPEAEARSRHKTRRSCRSRSSARRSLRRISTRSSSSGKIGEDTRRLNESFSKDSGKPFLQGIQDLLKQFD